MEWVYTVYVWSEEPGYSIVELWKRHTHCSVILMRSLIQSGHEFDFIENE